MIFATTVDNNAEEEQLERPRTMEQLKDEFQSLNILTQFIGPAKKPLTSVLADHTPKRWGYH